MSTLLMLLSQRLDPSRNKSCNLIEMCKSVVFFYWQRVDELLCMIHLSSLFFLDVDYLSLFFFSFDMPCGHVAYLLWVCIFYFFFLYSPYIIMITLQRDRHGTTWSFICGWMDVLAIFHV